MLFEGVSKENIEMLNSLAKKLKKLSALSVEDQKCLRSIRWEAQEISTNFNKFKEYFNYIITSFEGQERLYEQGMNEIHSNSEDKSALIDLLLTSSELDKFGIHFKKILFSSLLISIVSFLEEMILSFCTKYFPDYEKVEKGIIISVLDFLIKKNINITSNTKKIFRDVVSIRNDFVHHNGRINNSKSVKFEMYYLEENNNVPKKMILTKQFIRSLILQVELLFKSMYSDLYKLKEMEIVKV